MDLRSQYTHAQFAKLARQETDKVEFKTGLGQRALQATLVAFSNSTGGVIFVGVDDGGNVVGRVLDQGAEEEIHQAAATASDIGRYSIRQVHVDGVPVIAIVVAPREEGFAQTANGRVLVRRGPRNEALMAGELARFAMERTLRRFETADSRIDIVRADSTYVNELREAFGWSPDPENLDARLRERGLANSSGHLTIAGALLLTDPQQTLRQGKALIDVRRFQPGAEAYDRRVSFGGPLHHQIRDCTKFVLEEIGRDLVITGVYRHELPRLPEQVVRETVANAVAHRSYEMHGSSIVVELRPDKIVVQSPGALPGGVTEENIREAQSARNQNVIDVLRRLRLAEDAGRGVDLIQDEMKRALLDPPLFKDEGHAVLVTLPMRGPVTPSERAWIDDLEDSGQLQPDDRLILVHSARGEVMTNAVVREILGASESMARTALQRLRDMGFLVQHGRRGGTTYSLRKDIAPPAVYRMTRAEIAEMVVDAARRDPVTNSRVRELTGLSYWPALELLRRLVDEGRLERRGQKRGTHYVAR